VGEDDEILTNVITQGTLWQAIKILAIPSLITMLLQEAFNFTDMYFVGYLGSGAIAAVSMGGIITSILIGGVTGLSSGIVAVISRHIGEGNMERAENNAVQAILLAVLFAAAASLPCFFFSRDMIVALGADATVIDAGTSYLQIIFIGSVTIFLSEFIGAILRGAGDAETPMVALAIGALANLFLDPVMILGLFGCPKMGVAGSAWATVLTRGISVIIMLFILLRGKTVISLRKKYLKPDLKSIKRILTIGAPSSINAILINTSIMTVVSFLAPYGIEAVAVYGIDSRMITLVTVPAQGLGVAGAAIVGQNLGAKKHERALHSGLLLVALSQLIAVPVASVYYFYPELIISAFTKDPLTLAMGIDMMRIRMPGLFFLAMGNVLVQCINGSGDTMHPFMFSLVSLIGLRVLIAYTMPAFFGLHGLWYALVYPYILYATLNLLWFLSGRWAHIRI
jgi:putative MATE family efflux protein